MASPVELDLDALLRPVSDEQPAGTDLREDLSADSPFLKIKDARWAARAAERSGAADSETEAAADNAWRLILELAPQLLAERSKDLEVVSFWIEALTHERGFAGLRDGLKAAHGIVERFWPQLYPRPDESDGVATVVAPLGSLNGEGPDGPLPTRVALLPLVDPIDERGGFSTWHYQQARDLSKIADPEKRAERERSGAVTLESFESAVRETPVERLRDTLGDIEQALAEWEALGKALGERCGADAPSGSAVRDALSAALDTLRYAAKDKLAVAENAAAEAEALAQAGSSESGPRPARRGPLPGAVDTREDALKALQLAAAYFRRAEPHSPISYAIEQAVRWGSLSLPELLRELLSDDAARSAYFQRVGIREEPPAG